MFPSSVLALAAAALLRVGVSDLEADGVSTFVARQLTQLVVTNARDTGCVEPQPLRDLGEETAAELQGCFGQQTCLASVGRTLKLDKLLLGSVRKLDDALLLQLLVFDVAKRRVERQVSERLPTRPDALRDGVRRITPTVCAALSPAWAEAQNNLEIQLPPLASNDLPIPDLLAAAPPPPPKPAPPDFAPLPELDDLPPLPPPDPPPSAVVQKPQAPKAAPRVAAPTPKPAAPAAAVAPQLPVPRRTHPMVWWPTTLAAASGAALVTGVALGLWTRSLRAGDQTSLVDGQVAHSLTRVEAQQANRTALGADVAFGVGGALAVGAAVGFAVVPASRPTFLVEGQF